MKFDISKEEVEFAKACAMASKVKFYAFNLNRNALISINEIDIEYHIEVGDISREEINILLNDIGVKYNFRGTGWVAEILCV